MKRIVPILILCALGLAAWYFLKPDDSAGQEIEPPIVDIFDGIPTGAEDAGDAWADSPQAPEESIQYIVAGDGGGKWEDLQSGETVYEFPDGSYSRSQWVLDGGVLYYVDASGCRMENNYSHDGYYVGADGALDPEVRRIDLNLLPVSGETYRDDFGKTWKFRIQEDGGGTAHMAYPKEFSYEADYKVQPMGHSSYKLLNVKDEYDCWHAVVLEGGDILKLSAAGVTETYFLPKG